MGIGMPRAEAVLFAPGAELVDAPVGHRERGRHAARALRVRDQADLVELDAGGAKEQLEGLLVEGKVLDVEGLGEGPPEALAVEDLTVGEHLDHLRERLDHALLVEELEPGMPHGRERNGALAGSVVDLARVSPAGLVVDVGYEALLHRVHVVEVDHLDEHADGNRPVGLGQAHVGARRERQGKRDEAEDDGTTASQPGHGEWIADRISSRTTSSKRSPI